MNILTLYPIWYPYIMYSLEISWRFPSRIADILSFENRHDPWIFYILGLFVRSKGVYG